MPWTYRIVDHGEHFVLHEVELDDDGHVRDWLRRSIDFACDRDCSPGGIVSLLEDALKEARRAPVLKLTKDGALVEPA